MGTTGFVAVEGPSTLLDLAQQRVADLETKWSRFRGDSEVSRLNAAGGAPRTVSADTRRLVAAAVDAWRVTGGLFDPTVLPSLRGLGYSTTFDAIAADSEIDFLGTPAPGCSGISVDEGSGTVTLPLGVEFDAGGIGKGLAADMVATELLAAGAIAALVDLGGDIRCAGTHAWTIDIAHPWKSTPLAHLHVADAGIATSSTQRRRWGAGRQRHHIIDPRTGMPSATQIVAATVISADARSAEVWAKTILLRGGLLPSDLTAMVVSEDGAITASGDLAGLAA